MAEDAPNPFVGRHRGVLFCCLAASLFSMAMLYQMSPFFFHYAEAKAGATTAQVGLIFAALPLASFVAAIPSGFMVAKLGPKAVLNIGFLGLAASSLGFGLSESVEWWLFWRAVQGVTSAPISTAISCALANAFTADDQLEQVTGYQEAAANVGVLVAPLIGGVMFDYGGFFFPFAVNAAAQVLFVVINLMLSLKGRKVHDSSDGKSDALLAAEAAEAEPESSVGLWDVCYWQVVLVGGAAAMINGWMGATEPNMASHYRACFPGPPVIKPATIGLLIALQSAPSILGAVAVPMLPFNPVHTTGFGVFLIGLFTCAIGWSDPSIGDYSAIHYGFEPGSTNQWGLQIVISLLFGIAWPIAWTLIFPIMMDLAVGKLKTDVEAVSPHVSSVFNMTMFLGEALGPILGGAWISQVGWGSAFASLGGVLVLFAVVLIVALRGSRELVAAGDRKVSESFSESNVPIHSTGKHQRQHSPSFSESNVTMRTPP